MSSTVSIGVPGSLGLAGAWSSSLEFGVSLYYNAVASMTCFDSGQVIGTDTGKATMTMYSMSKYLGTWVYH